MLKVLQKGSPKSASNRGIVKMIKMLKVSGKIGGGSPPPPSSTTRNSYLLYYMLKTIKFLTRFNNFTKGFPQKCLKPGKCKMLKSSKFLERLGVVGSDRHRNF